MLCKGPIEYAALRHSTSFLPVIQMPCRLSAPGMSPLHSTGRPNNPFSKENAGVISCRRRSIRSTEAIRTKTSTRTTKTTATSTSTMTMKTTTIIRTIMTITSTRKDTRSTTTRNIMSTRKATTITSTRALPKG